MDGGSVLTDLCSIWYVNIIARPFRAPELQEMKLKANCSHLQEPKYRCPRCATRTCSLPCNQRHKARADCSGVRDPTAFLKKTELQTPAGFDHDFNFISGVERQLGRKQADGGEALQKIGNEGAEKFRRAKRAELYWRKIQESGVKVWRAPRGMQRERENESRVGIK